MSRVKLETHLLVFICSTVFVGSALGLIKNRKDSSHLGYFYGTPEHGLKLPTLKEEAKEVKEAIEEVKEEIEEEIEKEIEKEIVEKLEEDGLLHFHSNEYIPPRHHGRNERERRHGFRRKHGRNH